MKETSFIRRAVLAGALALSMAGASAVVDGAEAMPVAPAGASRAAPDAVVAVQYRYRGYPRRAGLYNCGPGGKRTHLNRKACGDRSPVKQYLYRR